MSDATFQFLEMYRPSLRRHRQYFTYSAATDALRRVSSTYIFLLCLISGFYSEGNWTCALLGHYSAYGYNSLQTFRKTLSDPIFEGKEIQEERFSLGSIDH